MSFSRYSLTNKTVFITGASSGIGAACARRFAAEGAKLLLCARRKDRLAQLADTLQKELAGNVYFFDLDVTQQQDVIEKIQNLPSEWRDIDILINNAGLAKGLEIFPDASIQDWNEMIDTNVKGLLYVTHTVLPSMVQKNTGHIINIGSIAGHEVYPKAAVYCATKHAVYAINQGLRRDLLGTNIRVSSIDPGMVKTEFSVVRFKGDTTLADRVYQGMQPLSPEDIADAIVYCATCPPHVNINEIIIMPTAQAAATLVSRDA